MTKIKKTNTQQEINVPLLWAMSTTLSGAYFLLKMVELYNNKEESNTDKVEKAFLAGSLFACNLYGLFHTKPKNTESTSALDFTLLNGLH